MRRTVTAPPGVAAPTWKKLTYERPTSRSPDFMELRPYYGGWPVQGVDVLGKNHAGFRLYAELYERW